MSGKYTHYTSNVATTKILKHIQTLCSFQLNEHSMQSKTYNRHHTHQPGMYY